MKNKRPTVTAHVLVKNEEVYISAAINSVLPYVDKMIIFDTGSTDKTIEIIKAIVEKDKNKKIIFEEKGEVDKQQHTDLRNEMIHLTASEWILILDGDEVWDSQQLLNLFEEASYQPLTKVLGLVSFQLYTIDENYFTELGHYYFSWGMHNQINMRLIRNLPGIKFFGKYGTEGLYIKDALISDQKYYFLSTSYYHHFSKLYRSSNDRYVFERKKPSIGKYLGPFRKLFIKKATNLPNMCYEKD